MATSKNKTCNMCETMLLLDNNWEEVHSVFTVIEEGR